MAIIYEKGKGTTYTGFDKVQYTFGNMIEKIKSAPSRILDGIEARDKKRQDFKRKRNTKMIENTFGSVENYNNFANGTSTKQK